MVKQPVSFLSKMQGARKSLSKVHQNDGNADHGKPDELFGRDLILKDDRVKKKGEDGGKPSVERIVNGGGECRGVDREKLGNVKAHRRNQDKDPNAGIRKLDPPLLLFLLRAVGRI